MKVGFRYVDQFTDRHGTKRFYFRLPGGPRIALPGLPGSKEFSEAYHLAKEGLPLPARSEAPKIGTFNKLVAEYFSSGEFKSHSENTRKAYERTINNWIKAEGIGHRPVVGLSITHISGMMGKRSTTPAAANDMLKKIRLLMGFAIRHKYRTDDPTLKLKKYDAGEFHTWTEAQISKFEERWPIGSKPRLAFSLLLYTGQRLSDVVKMKWTDFVGAGIHVRQQKTDVKVFIPIHKELLSALTVTKREGETILLSESGSRYNASGFSKWMAAQIERAKLPPECVTHGLRKAAARRLAEAGCSTKQIASVTGHRSISEVERYVKAAEQNRLAVDAMILLAAKNSQPLLDRLEK